MSLTNCAIASAQDLNLSPVAQGRRNACLGKPAQGAPNCDKHIWVSLYFDGTNNNAQRDQKNVADPDKRSHSNVVVLYDACKDDHDNGYYAFYIPGVGTPFKEIGELAESDEGKAFGWGGESRIYWGMIQVLNAMFAAITDNNAQLVSDARAGKDVKSEPLYSGLRVEANYTGMDMYFKPLIEVLQKKLANTSKPVLKQVNLSVFGFSRGAAQARAFCTFMDRLCAPNGQLAGVALNFQFVGLFDTVASVGVADASNAFHGFGGYANGTQDIPARVKRCTHYVAGHEKRKAFPLSSLRSAKHKGYPANCHEVVYPGSHSDVGGGYCAGSQGKSTQGRSALLSQVPLRHMYTEARTYGVPLLSAEELLSKSDGLAVAKDLELHPSLSMAFNAYHAWYGRPHDGPQLPNSPVHWYDQGHASVEMMLVEHVNRYNQWRCIVGHDAATFAALDSYRKASKQDREDLWNSNAEFQREAGTGLKKPQYQQTAEETDLAHELKREAPRQLVHAFFDQYVHDSHASFYMVGPITDQDRQELITRARHKLALARGHTFVLNRFERALVADGVSVQRFPLMQDADTQAIADAKGMTSSAEAAVLSKTRRESGPFVRYRHVFDDSRGTVSKLFSETHNTEPYAMERARA